MALLIDIAPMCRLAALQAVLRHDALHGASVRVDGLLLPQPQRAGLLPPHARPVLPQLLRGGAAAERRAARRGGGVDAGARHPHPPPRLPGGLEEQRAGLRHHQPSAPRFGQG